METLRQTRKDSLRKILWKKVRRNTETNKERAIS